MSETHSNIPSASRKILARIFSKIKVSENNFYNGSPCWEWQRGKTGAGYAAICINYTDYLVHRLLYQFFVGEPGKLHCDHLCRVRGCVNPAHIEPVPLRENVLRGEGIAARNAKKEFCKYGHILADENVKIYQNKGKTFRQCIECQKRRKNKFQEKLKTIPFDHPLKQKQREASNRAAAKRQQLPYDHPVRVAVRASKKKYENKIHENKIAR